VVSVVVHNLAQSLAAAKAAASTGQRITIRSTPGIGRSLGIGGWLALVKLTQQAAPKANIKFTFDSGIWPGDAYAAIAGGVDQIAMDDTPAFSRLRKLADEQGVLIDGQPADIDLAFELEPKIACQNLLETNSI